jgi:hypothetical protein
MDINIYHPFTETEYTEMYNVVKPITGEIPSHGNTPAIIWNSFKKLSNTDIPQPCTCKSTIKYWIDAVNELQGFIEHVELKKEESSQQNQNPS